MVVVCRHAPATRAAVLRAQWLLKVAHRTILLLDIKHTAVFFLFFSCRLVNRLWVFGIHSHTRHVCILAFLRFTLTSPTSSTLSLSRPFICLLFMSQLLLLLVFKPSEYPTNFLLNHDPPGRFRSHTWLLWNFNPQIVSLRCTSMTESLLQHAESTIRVSKRITCSTGDSLLLIGAYYTYVACNCLLLGAFVTFGYLLGFESIICSPLPFCFHGNFA